MKMADTRQSARGSWIWAAHYLTRIRWGPAEAGTEVPTTEIQLGDSWARGRNLMAVSTERARTELADGAQQCAVCRPDRVLNRF